MFEKLQTEKFAYQKMRIFNIFIGSEAESSELYPTKNRIENDRLDDEKISNLMIVPTYWDTLYFDPFLQPLEIPDNKKKLSKGCDCNFRSN